jgi:putative ABC transport system ATP-binding protein
LESIRQKARLPELVEVRTVQHFYGDGEGRKQVLFDNSLVVNPGEIVIMTGPSGSGKTTLLTLIGTLRSVQAGSLRVLGQELCGAKQHELIALRKKLGFIFQAHNLFGSLTAYQNVKMALELFNHQHRDNDRRIKELLARLGLEERIHYKPANLSGGQKQRVAIARGLAHRPKIILADEPTAALDEQSGREVVTMFQEMASQEGCAIIMVTHDNRILDVADRIVSMVDGHIRSDVSVQVSAAICEFLKKSDVFKTLTPQSLTQVADHMFVEELAAGQVVIRQGDVGDRFYLIGEGTVDVSVADTSGERTVATLREGAFFGEAALLTGEPRNATVTATSDLTAYVLGQEHFKNALAASDTFEEELRKALFNRQ